jgi:hypothetical protein
MTLENHLIYHEDKITRLYEQHDQIQGYIHKLTAKNSHLKAGELLELVKQLYAIEMDLRVSIDTRLTLINIKSNN